MKIYELITKAESVLDQDVQHFVHVTLVCVYFLMKILKNNNFQKPPSKEQSMDVDKQEDGQIDD